MPKTLYFNPDKFVDSVISEMKLGDTRAPTLLALRQEIERLLSERIVGTVIESFGKRELILYEKMLEDHLELDEIDALMVLAPDLPGVKEQMEKNINSLFFELVRDAEQVEKHMKPLKA